MLAPWSTQAISAQPQVLCVRGAWEATGACSDPVVKKALVRRVLSEGAQRGYLGQWHPVSCPGLFGMFGE